MDVMLIILAMITAAAAMEAAGGVDHLVGLAERAIRSKPRRVVYITPLVSWAFTLGAGTAHVFYPLLPVIHDVAREGGIRPERPIGVSSIAATFGITASPVSAAMAAMIVLFSDDGWSLPRIMAVAVPATLLGVLAAAALRSRLGAELERDSEYLRRLAAGEIEPPAPAEGAPPPRPRASWSAYLFLAGTAGVVLSGLFPQLRPDTGKGPLSMPATIEILMMAVAALILLLCKVDATRLPATDVARSGFVAVIGVFGRPVLHRRQRGPHHRRARRRGRGPSVVLRDHVAAPLHTAVQPGHDHQGPDAAGPGTTRVGRFVVNHSFMLPGFVTTCVAISTGLAMVRIV